MDAELDKVLIWGIALHRPPVTLREYQLQSRGFLAGLQDASEKFRYLSHIGQANAVSVPIDLNRLEPLIASAVFDPEYPDDYLNLSPNGSLCPDSLSKIGFSVTYCSFDPIKNAAVPLAHDGVRIRLQGTSAAQESETSVTVELSGGECWRSGEQRKFRSLLQYCLEKWQCSFGGVSHLHYEQKVRGSDPASYAGQWLFYLPFPHLAKCLPSDIHHEPFANGILIETTPDMPYANNAADLVAGKRVRDVLDEFGLVNHATYAIEGWPPDAEESRYEQFISGAPADRKYTVHCVNFDGYDPDRKILLYAKLFRRLRRHPKEWGLRGWDGPVLNEAKRQVRAAAKAGGVPIEWHIGLEEPAHAVRQLLGDHTNITEQQLRVLYTPIEEALQSSPP